MVGYGSAVAVVYDVVKLGSFGSGKAVEVRLGDARWVKFWFAVAVSVRYLVAFGLCMVRSVKAVEVALGLFW